MKRSTNLLRLAAAALAGWAVCTAVDAREPPTWSGNVVEIVHRACAGCHHAEGSAPMSLTTYDEARPWARSIAREVESRSMPPWHADAERGVFANDRRLDDGEREVLLSWAAAGSPRGDGEEPIYSTPVAGAWRIGVPDLIIEMPEEVTIPPVGEIPYHDYIVDPGFLEDVWVRAAESLPGNRDVVHHIIVGYLIEDPLARHRMQQEGLEARVQGSLGGYVPGDEPLVLADGLARLIPAGAKIYFQMHYTPTGREETDRSRLGLIFADGPPRYEVRTGLASSPFIHIPAGVESKSLEADFEFARESVLLSMRPHLHLRGKSFEYRLTYPDGSEEVLLHVPHYDFAWQTRYVLSTPKPIPAGTKLTATGTWDNSADNSDNPDPTRTVSWGQQTTDEMMIGFFEYHEKRRAD